MRSSERQAFNDGFEKGCERARKHIAQLEAENDTYKHEVSVLRQLLDDDGTLALKTIEEQEGEIISLKKALRGE